MNEYRPFVALHSDVNDVILVRVKSESWHIFAVPPVTYFSQIITLRTEIREP
jgi:hypothetical protein